MHINAAAMNKMCGMTVVAIMIGMAGVIIALTALAIAGIVAVGKLAKAHRGRLGHDG
jgi:hypothetical protein